MLFFGFYATIFCSRLKNMDKNGNKILMGLDVSTACIGCAIIVDDGSKYGNVIELTHVSPKAPKNVSGIETLFIKKDIFNEEFLAKWKDIGIDEVVIEEPLVRSNNVNTCATLLRFNGMISDCVYHELGVVPSYISSYDARQYSFPELMSVRKYGKDENIYARKKILKEIKSGQLVLFGAYPWNIDKKTVIQGKVSENLPDITWIYNKNNELKKENFDACDAYVAVLAHLNKQRNGELEFKISDITENGDKVEYEVEYWGEKHHRTTYLPEE